MQQEDRAPKSFVSREEMLSTQQVSPRPGLVVCEQYNNALKLRMTSLWVRINITVP